LDINDHEDLFEEVARIYGYNLIPPKPPHLRLVETEDENLIALKEKLENILIGFGFTEAVSNSLIGKNDISEREVAEKNLFELENYISEEFKYLRPNLISGLKKITLHNLKFFNEVKLFEIGNVFLNKKEEKEREKTNLCVLSASKKENTFFELKGVISALLNRIGAFDFVYKEKQTLSKDLEILIDGKGVGKLGFLKLEDSSLLSFAEINLKELLKFIEEENEFKPLPKYPIVYRDISFLVDRKFKIGEIIESVSYLDKRIEDVDLIDEYFDKSLGENRQSLTLRLFLNPQDHTFSAEEIEDIMTNVVNFIKEKFNAQIR
jgi:phenylalanyl-tRNA synthetase beta chain